MICPNCGKELADNALFCTGCGTRMEAKAAPAPAPAPAVSMVDFTAKLKNVLGSGLFLAIAILSTLAAMMFVFANILATLTAIAMWTIYIAAKTEKHTCKAGLKFSSGILKAKSIINWICIVSVAVTLAITLVAVPLMKNAIERVQEEMNEDFRDILEEMPKDFDLEDAIDDILDEAYSNEEVVEDLEQVEKQIGMDLDRDSVEDMLEKFGIKNMEKGIDWMVDNKDNVFTKIIDTVTTVMIAALSASLVIMIVFNVLILGRLRKFARTAWQAVEANDASVINLKLLRSALVAAGIFSLATPFAAAACFVGVALVNRLREELA